MTQGDWEVIGKELWFDVVNSIVYFIGLKEGPLEQHVYAVSLHRPLEIRLLTRPGYSYSNVYFNKECTMMVAVYSSIKSLPACQVKIKKNFKNHFEFIGVKTNNYKILFRYFEYHNRIGLLKVFH